uniref:GGDEF domain-containing protein n=1 Tax=Vibrio vulnificus TaxID=672 RepID=UPI001EEBECBE
NFKFFNDTTMSHDSRGQLHACLGLQPTANPTKTLPQRHADCVGRYGGEEFVVLLGGSDAEQAVKAAERIHKAVADLSYPHAFSAVSDVVTLSQGVYTFIPNGREELQTIYQFADKALYQAKLEGKNRYVTFRAS